MAGHILWFTLPFLALAGGQLEPGLGDFGRPLAIATLPFDLGSLTSDSEPLAIGLDDVQKGSCAGHCLIDLEVEPGTDVWILWDGNETRGFQAGVRSGTGWTAGIPAFDAAFLRDPGDGDIHVWGTGRFVAASVPAFVPGVPNLAAMVPHDLGFRPPEGSAAHPGCLAEEVAEGATRCFRFSSGLANTGSHQLELSAGTRLDDDAPVVLTQDLGDGERVAGEAEFHASHGHFHYNGLMTFALHAFNESTGLRSDAILAKSKTGFCMVDWGLQQDHGPETPRKSFWRDECRRESDLLRMGISPGWYDLYSAVLPEQYLDADAIPDGTYELVMTIDPEETLVEAHRLDNQASVRFRYAGGEVEILEGRGLFHL